MKSGFAQDAEAVGANKAPVFKTKITAEMLNADGRVIGYSVKHSIYNSFHDIEESDGTDRGDLAVFDPNSTRVMEWIQMPAFGRIVIEAI